MEIGQILDDLIPTRRLEGDVVVGKTGDRRMDTRFQIPDA